MEDLTPDEQYVRDELERVYPQLLINERKILGDGYDAYGGDLMAVAIEFFLKKPVEQQLKTIQEGKLENFITFIANVQAKRSSTYFYKHYRDHSTRARDLFGDYIYLANQLPDEEEPEPYNDPLHHCIQKVISKLNPFEKMLVQEKWLDKKMYKTIAAKYDIPERSLAYGCDKLRAKIKRLCGQYR